MARGACGEPRVGHAGSVKWPRRVVRPRGRGRVAQRRRGVRYAPRFRT
nr:hypothetical protein RVX_2038 [Nitratidesulfovibrio sp. HK-II]